MNTLTSINPATEEIIHSFNAIGNSQIEEKIETAGGAFIQWKDTSWNKRAELLLSMSSLLNQRKEQLAKTITMEMGKPIGQSIGEIEKCAWLCEYYAENAKKFLAPEPIESDAGESYLQYDPLGVLLGIMPWNFPFWQVFRFAVPSIAAGNTILIKHAPNVCLTALNIEKLFLEAGFAGGILQVLLIDVEAVRDVITAGQVKGVSVTASEKTGSSVAELAGMSIKKSVLELGGSDPFIILDDADLSEACNVCNTSRLINSGQTCISAKRFIVVESRYDEFLNALINDTRVRKVGDPMDMSTDIGPLARLDILENLYRQVDESVNKGARVVYHGDFTCERGYFFSPMIIDNVVPGMPLYEEETFGPVGAVIKATDTADAIKIANDTKYGLGASIWTQNIELAKNLAGQINAGHVSINGMVKSDPRLPFGGINRSGYGRELSYAGCREFVNIKTIWIK